MDDEVLEMYEKVKDKLTEEEFEQKINEISQGYEGISFMSDLDIAKQIVDSINGPDENDSLTNSDDVLDIGDLEEGSQGVIAGLVTSISNPKSFKTRKGKEGKVCNLELEDNTGKIRVVLWTENIKLLKNFEEGDIVKITDVDIKEGYMGGNEANLRPRSTITHFKDADLSKFPEYNQNITDIEDLVPDTKANIIARIIRIPTPRTYEKNGKEGKVTSLELKDATGEISYTLWNKNVDLIEELGLDAGDSVKILGAQVRERNGEKSLTHWDGRIIKGDFDVPEFNQEFIKIGDITEQNNVAIKGVISKLQDIRTFMRKSDNSEGKLRNFEVTDDTGSIRTTVWGNDTDLPINKGDIVKIIGADARFDDYTESGYSLNTNFNTQITLNPENLSVEEMDLFDELKQKVSQIIRLSEVEEFDEDGAEVDVIGRIFAIGEINEFQRDDGSVGYARSASFSDGEGRVRLSFWDDKAKQEYKPGDAYKLENARVRLGMYEVELNIGSSARVIKLSEDDNEARFLPSFKTIETMLYKHKSISDVEEDDEGLIVTGRVIEANDVHEFNRDDGTKGFVKSLEIADNSGSINVTLWNENAKKEWNAGDAIKFQDPQITYRNDSLEINVSRSTSILEPNETELEELPTYDELKESIYVPKTIESLEDDDRNVRITGTLKEVFGNKVLITKCPSCGNTIDQSSEEFVCEFCGDTIDEPRYLLMIPARLEDDTGEISITFFDNLAEELLDMKKEEIISITDNGSDLGVMEGKIDDLNGLTVEVITNVSFDDYNEEIRLNPKRILSKYY
ncbi:replication factor A [uncultured Methanobrevibacter sp.]|uniref:replication factor A n=1 Tax=uncultured Methanobrevibacter sp. TaxID=253161 RepID=UPI00260BBA33|nr:replication factor A [uncultured Methanobrevibacter sp.]